MNAQTAIIIQARLGSSRLPGKVLKKICNKPMLELELERLKLCREIDEIIIATTTAVQDDAIESFCIQNGVRYYRGSETNVLRRYIEAAQHYNLATIIRVTADCPLIDPELIDELIRKHRTEENEYTSNVIQRTFPRGFDAEVINFETLVKIEKMADEPRYFEHVTLYTYTHPEKFKMGNLEATGIYHNPGLRLTVDTIEDFELIEAIYRNLYRGTPINNRETLLFLQCHPELLQLNHSIKQKEV